MGTQVIAISAVRGPIIDSSAATSSAPLASLGTTSITMPSRFARCRKAT